MTTSPSPTQTKPSSTHDIQIALAAASLAGQYASRNPMPMAAIPSLITEIHNSLVNVINAGPKVHLQLAELPSQDYYRLPPPQPGKVDVAALVASRSPVHQKAAADEGVKVESRFKAEYVVGPPSVAPFLPVENSVFNSQLICLACGKSFATLKRHVLATHHMDDIEYRKVYGLSAMYPMICEQFQNGRRDLMQKHGAFKPLTKADHAKRRKMFGPVNDRPAKTAANGDGKK